MASPFVAEIRIFAGNFAPKGWAFCNGQLLPISQNTALFSLLGTTYGGDGRSNFGLPNLQGSVPLQAGQGPGLSLRDLGETGGETAVTLLTTELPAHSHSLSASSAAGDAGTPAANALAEAKKQKFGVNAYASGAGTSPLGPTLNPNGGNQAHNNMPPYLVLTFIIALQGVFPPRS